MSWSLFLILGLAYMGGTVTVGGAAEVTGYGGMGTVPVVVLAVLAAASAMFS